ncbi:MAG: hypothetical protein AB8G11_14560 [Saprospiraceae bacterium]
MKKAFCEAKFSNCDFYFTFQRNVNLWEREINYTGKIENEQIPINFNEAKKMLPISLPMSNISFNLGLQVNL